MSSSARFLWLLLASVLLAKGAHGQSARKPERFVMPTLYVEPDDRIFPHPPWVATQWVANEDAPFQAVEVEVKPYRDGFRIDRSGVWPAKAREAHARWRADCQDPVNLYRACSYYDVARAVDQTFGVSKEDVRIRDELRIGWDIIRNPPRSYLFVRRGYGWNAGDHHRHIFGDLGKALLAKNPADRYVAHSMLGEMQDERHSKDADLEQLLIDTFERIRKTPAWSFLNYTGLAACYEHRAFRTFKRSDMKKAIEYGDLAFKGAPKGYDATWLEKARDNLVRRMKYMKYD